MLRSSLFYSLFIFLFSATLSAQNESLSLTIKFSGTSGTSGNIMLRISDSKGKELKLLNFPADAQPLEIKVKLEPGSYAIAAYHDANDNKKLDKSFTGIPSENYGFSNNARGTFGPPSLSDQLFDLKSETSISIELK